MLNRMCKYLAILVLFIANTACAQTLDCERDNSALQSMHKSLVTFTRNDGSEFSIEVKTADNNRTRAAGFQKVCESTIRAEPILFLFPRAFKARFHMNNVVAPIDIAFFDKQGNIRDIQTMHPYVLGALKKPLYGPPVPVIGALETHEGFYEKHNIDTQSKLQWEAIK